MARVSQNIWVETKGVILFKVPFAHQFLMLGYDMFWFLSHFTHLVNSEDLSVSYSLRKSNSSKASAMSIWYSSFTGGCSPLSSAITR